MGANRWSSSRGREPKPIAWSFNLLHLAFCTDTSAILLVLGVTRGFVLPVSSLLRQNGRVSGGPFHWSGRPRVPVVWAIGYRVISPVQFVGCCYSGGCSPVLGVRFVEPSACDVLGREFFFQHWRCFRCRWRSLCARPLSSDFIGRIIWQPIPASGGGFARKRGTIMLPKR